MEEGQQERRAKLLTRASPDKFALLDDLCRTSWQKKRDSRLLKEAVTEKQEAYVLALVEGFVRRTCVCGCVWMDEWVGGYIYL